MTRGILIAGNESSLYSAIAAEAAKRVESYAAALIPNRLPVPGTVPQPKKESAGAAINLSWNPSSPISARTLILSAENRLGKINDAILICSPPAIYKTADLLEPEEIEILTDDHIKGWFFLARELVLYFRRSHSGSLSFVAPEIGPASKNAQTDLLGPSAAASFTNFASGVLASSADEPFLTLGFSSPEAGSKAEFASWLFKIIDELSTSPEGEVSRVGARKYSGRWNKFSKISFLR